MRSKIALILLCATIGGAPVRAQEAASAIAPTPTPSITPIPDLLIPSQTAVPDIPAIPVGPAEIPELSQLDAAFKRTSLGKDAEETRMRIEARDLKNRVALEPEIVAARTAADVARTDVEKRELLRRYYNVLYARMRSLAGSDDLRIYLDNEEKTHLGATAQPRVRPIAGLSATPRVKHRKKKDKSP